MGKHSAGVSASRCIDAMCGGVALVLEALRFPHTDNQGRSWRALMNQSVASGGTCMWQG